MFFLYPLNWSTVSLSCALKTMLQRAQQRLLTLPGGGHVWALSLTALIHPPGPFYPDLTIFKKPLPHTQHLEQGKLEDILQNPPAALFMTDYRQDKDKELQAYVEDGGLLVVFATPQLTEQASPLFPVRLRSAGRDLGGALRWDKPRNLDVFSSTSPFTGLTIPQNLKVRRQILTQPEPDLEKKIWARLEDGTPPCDLSTLWQRPCRFLPYRTPAQLVRSSPTRSFC